METDVKLKTLPSGLLHDLWPGVSQFARLDAGHIGRDGVDDLVRAERSGSRVGLLLWLRQLQGEAAKLVNLVELLLLQPDAQLGFARRPVRGGGATSFSELLENDFESRLTH